MGKQWQKYITSCDAAMVAKLTTIVMRILSGDRKDLDIKPMRGMTNMFRCKIGSVRILFSCKAGITTIIKIGPRGDVYK